jgi:hypothetical protein
VESDCTHHTWTVLIFGKDYIGLSKECREVIFEVLKAEAVNMSVFWVVSLCSLVEIYRYIRGVCCLLRQGDELCSVYSLP